MDLCISQCLCTYNYLAWMCVSHFFKGLGVVLTCIGYKLALLPVALGWSCGAQRVGFDAGSEGKIRTQDESPKTYTHALAQS